MNADSIRHEPLEILPDSEKDTLVAYLKEHVDNVEVVVMDMIHSFKAVLRKALNYLTIVADCFTLQVILYWAFECVRIRMQRKFPDYDRKKCNE
ncbi:transposase [Bacillus halotolerans]|uniref:transposase n=1 Tax=Bacillus halotolerans TaxID=260554 RepID=UPI003462D4FA